jgi:hypothetical protein
VLGKEKVRIGFFGQEKSRTSPRIYYQFLILNLFKIIQRGKVEMGRGMGYDGVKMREE